MSMLENIKNTVKSKLDNVVALQEVHQYPEIKFNGYPAATIVPSDNESDFETTTENQRVYAFTIRLFSQIKGSGLEKAYGQMYNLIDEVLDEFDKDQGLSGLTLPTGYTMIISEALPSAVGLVAETDLLMAMVTIRVRILIDTKIIT